MTPQEKWICGILGLVFFGMFLAEIFTDYEPTKISALLIVLFWIPLLILHEAGHAFVASMLGWYVGRVVIGMGRTVKNFRVGSINVEVRLVPIEGFVRCIPKNLNSPQIKSALIYIAGPGIELLLAALILLLVGPDKLLSTSDDYWLITLQSLAIAATMGGVLNLIPHYVITPNGDFPNDGLGIIRSFLLPESHYADMIGQQYNPQEEDWEPYDPADWWKRGYEE